MKVHIRADRSGPAPGPGESWPIAHVELVEARERENLPTAFVDRAVLEGWATLDRGKLVLHAKPKVTYTILRGPGRYCCHDDTGPFESAEAAAAYVAANFDGADSPDPDNPAGYRVDNFYACEKAS